VRRFKKEGYNLDLTYITDRLIALGITADESSIAIWRNSAQEVWSFLETHHSGHWKIFSLNSQPSIPDVFRDRTFWFGWSEGHAPSLDLLFKLLYSVDDWLRLNERNVAVLYSRGGKGRAGVAIAGYLAYTATFPSADAAINYYASMRSPQRIGISIPSQRRYVKYVSQAKAPPMATKKILRRLVMRPVPSTFGTITPVVKIYDPRGVQPFHLLYKTPPEQRRPFMLTDAYIVVDLNIEVEGGTTSI